MLKIQVLGKGLIPRGLGLAPRMAPFPADLTLISTILATPNLKINYQREDGVFLPLTRKNAKEVWDKAHSKKKTVAANEAVNQTAPVAPVPPTPAPAAPETPPAKEPEKPTVNPAPAPAAPAVEEKKPEASVKPAAPQNPPKADAKTGEQKTPEVKPAEDKKEGTEEKKADAKAAAPSSGVKPVHTEDLTKK